MSSTSVITGRRTSWIALLIALVIGLGLASFAAKLGDIQQNDVASWLPGDAQSTVVLERSAQFSDPNALPALVVFENPSGIAPSLEAISGIVPTIEKLEGLDQAAEVVGPTRSSDQQAAQLIVTLHLGSDGWNALPDVIDQIRSVSEDAVPAGTTVHIAGPAAFGADQSTAFAGIDGILLIAALAVVVVLLLLTYRSPILWLIPLICAIVSVGAAEGSVYLAAKAFDLTVNGQSSGILSVLVLGASIDYALLLVSRYREELRNVESRHEAMSIALHRAAPAIVASGGTVVVGLLCLLLAQMNSTAGLGPVGAIGILAALFMMLVLLPALLVILGRWIFWPFIPRFGDEQPHDGGIWGAIGQRIARAPRLVWVVTVAALAVACLGTLQLNATGLSDKGTFTTEQPSIAAAEVLREHFPTGDGSPVEVVSAASAAQQIRSTLQSVDGLDADSVTEPVVKGETAYVRATLSSPPDSDAAFDTIDRTRDALADVRGADAAVGGQTAINLDVQRASAADNRLIIPVVLVVVLLILMVLLRSITAPLILLATVVLSFGAALGLSALFFRHVFGFEGADSSLPLFVFVFLVALGVDYNIFLMTRVREESARHGARRAALIGLAATGGVITSAGFVLAGTFAALAALPLVFLAELGFAVALGVLLDTLVVRSILVTALTLDVGDRIWWPSSLSHRHTDEESTGTMSLTPRQ